MGLQAHAHLPPEDDTDMVAKGWRHELVPVNTLRDDSIRDAIRELYLNGAKDRLEKDILDSDSPVVGIYQQNVTNRLGIDVDTYIQQLGDDSHLVGNPDRDNPEGGLDSHFATYWQNDVLRSVFRLIPAGIRVWDGKQYEMCHHMDGLFSPDADGSMSWIYTKWFWRAQREMAIGAGFDGYNYAGIEGSRNTTVKIRQLQADAYNELMVDSEVLYQTHPEDGTKGIATWHYYR